MSKDEGSQYLMDYKVNLVTGTIYFLVILLLLFGNTHWYLALTGGD